MANSNTQTPLVYREELQKIIDKRKIIMQLREIQVSAFLCGAKALERLNQTGAHYVHEHAIMLYHANNPGACVLQDEYTRGAICAAIHAITKLEERRES